MVEEVYKPKHGKDVLANKVIDIIKNDPYNNYVVSDLGLPEEEIIVPLPLTNRTIRNNSITKT